jgi:hypothetical protein
MGRLVLAGRELTRLAGKPAKNQYGILVMFDTLAGFSQRVSLLLDVLQELEQGRCASNP